MCYIQNSNMRKESNPKIRELKQLIAKVRNELWDLLDEYYYYTNVLYTQIMFEYDSIFGDIEEQIQEKDRLARELEYKIHYLSNKKTTRGNSNPVNYNLNGNNTFKNGQSTYYVPNCKVNEEYEAQQLYRQIVKKLHPDVAGITPEFNRFWNNIQDSYKNTDVQRLRIFYQTIVNDPLNKEISDSSREEIALKTELKDLEYNLNKLKSRLKQLQDQEPYIFKEKLKDRIWVATRKQKLMLKLFQIDNEILNRKKILRNLSANNLNYEIAN